MDDIRPVDHGEAVAIFRSQVIGGLCCRELSRGELQAGLLELSQQRLRPPGSTVTRTYSVPTLQRWVYAFRRRGLAGLRPEPRSDRGRAQGLTEDQRQLVLDVRREHPSASAELILGTLVADGRIEAKATSPATLRRLFVEQGLDRVTMARAGKRVRLRWQAEHPDALWHGDVCHGPALLVGGRKQPLRIHALLDDATRYVVALEAHHQEREDEMLELLIAALRRRGRPDALYLDNGSTYRGAQLSTVCARLGITLLHAAPYDPQARGKMERFWRTLREGCLDFLGEMASLHDVNVRLWAFLDQHYHPRPHAALMGKSPEVTYRGQPRSVDRTVEPDALRGAMTVRERRRVRRDSTVSVGGVDYEVDAAFLSGRVVTVVRCLLDVPPQPTLEYEGRMLPLAVVDPTRNSRRPRAKDPEPPSKTTPFDPPGALLDQAVGRRPRHAGPREDQR